MFGFGGKETPLLQAYGKLPLAKDYLRVGAGEGTARAFRDWLDQSFSGRAGEEPPTLPWPARFVIGAGGGEALLGTAWPSSDTGGLRRFPFTLFVERKRKPLLESLAHGLRDEAAWWERIEAFHTARGNFADGQGFLAALRGKTVEGAKQDGAPADGDDDPDEADHVGWQAWTTTLWPEDAQAGLFDALRAIEALARDRQATALRLPLVDGLPPLEQLGAWLLALAELGWLARGEIPTLFFPHAATTADAAPATGGAAAFLVALRAPLSARDVAWLTQPAGSPQLQLGDLHDGRPRAAGRDALERGPELAASMRGALATFRARR